MKFKISISKFLEEEIEATTQEEAESIAWEIWSQDDEVEFYCDEVKE